MSFELRDHQVKALKRMRNGCILNGSVGSGKSVTALAYNISLEDLKNIYNVEAGDAAIKTWGSVKK